MKKFNLNLLDDITLNSVGKIKLDIFQTENTPYMMAKTDNESFTINIDEHNNIHLQNSHKADPRSILKRTEKNKTDKNQNPISILVDLIQDIVDLAKKPPKDSLTLQVSLYLKENTNLTINSENLDISIHQTMINKLIIDCSNLHIKGDKYSISSFKIDSSNLSAHLIFDSKNKHIEIDSSNIKLSLLVDKNFDGELDIDGNNVKYDDPNSLRHKLINSSSGLLNADVNNAKITISNYSG